MLSQLETDWFFAFHAIRGIKDIREQYPLTELEETRCIAEKLGINHPTDPQTREPCLATSDFVLTIHDGLREVDMAIAVKPSADLSSVRTLEKLEIERVYWSARKISWQILTEKELPRALVKTLRWVHPHIDLVSSGALTAGEVARIRSTVEPAVIGGNQSLVDATADCDDRLGLRPGSALCVARHLIGTGVWPVDLTVEIDPRRPLQLIQNGGTNVTASQLTA